MGAGEAMAEVVGAGDGMEVVGIVEGIGLQSVLASARVGVTRPMVTTMATRLILITTVTQPTPMDTRQPSTQGILIQWRWRSRTDRASRVR